MSSAYLVTLAALSLVAGELDQSFVSLAQQMSSMGHNVQDQVQQWNSNQGLEGARQIHQNFGTLSSRIQDLNSAANELPSASPSDTGHYVYQLNGISSTIVSLLDSLTEKSGDFQDVNALQIVGSDVNDLAAPAASIESALLERLPSDAPCSAVNSVSNIVSSLDHAFQEAGSAYSVSVPQEAPSAPTSCSENGVMVAVDAYDNGSDGGNANAINTDDSTSKADEKQTQGEESTTAAGAEPTHSSEHHSSHHSDSSEHETSGTHSESHHHASESASTRDHAGSTGTGNEAAESHHTRSHSSHHNGTHSHHTHSAKHSKNQAGTLLSGLGAGFVGILAFLV